MAVSAAAHLSECVVISTGASNLNFKFFNDAVLKRTAEVWFDSLLPSFSGEMEANKESV